MTNVNQELLTLSWELVAWLTFSLNTWHELGRNALSGKAKSGEVDDASAGTNSLGRNPVVGVTDVCSNGTTSLAGKPVAGVMENASTSTFLPSVHASHGHEMDSLSTSIVSAYYEDREVIHR